MNDRQLREIYRWAQTAYGMYRGIVRSRNVNEVPPRLPRSQDAPEVAAAVTRSDLGLGPEVPIPNLINTLEKVGGVRLSVA